MLTVTVSRRHHFADSKPDQMRSVKITRPEAQLFDSASSQRVSVSTSHARSIARPIHRQYFRRGCALHCTTRLFTAIMGVLYECPCAICSRHPSGGRYVSRETFYRHGGSNMALSRAKSRRTDDAAADEDPSALDPGHDGSVEEEEASDGAHTTGRDEQDEETDGGVLDRTGGGSVGAWAVDRRGSDSGGNGDGSVKSDGSDDGERLEEEDLPLDVFQNFPLSDGGDDNEAGENAEDPGLLLQQALQPLDDVQHGAPDNEHVGQSTPAAVSTNGVALSPEAFADMVHDFVAFNFAQEYNPHREALATMLKQRTHRGLKNRTPYKLDKFVNNAVRLEEKIVHCCRNGCMAYTAKHAQANSCPF